MEAFTMNPKTISKVNRFGKIGKIIMTVLTVAAILVTVLSCGTAIYASTLPKDAVTISVTNQAEFKIKKNVFSTVWSMLTKNASYTTDKDPSDMLKDGNNESVLPAENTQIDTNLNFFNQSYSSATIRSDGNEKIIDAKSSPSEYRSSDLVTLIVFIALLAASASVALFMLQKLFKVLSVCESPFCSDFVSKLRAFGYTLLPVALFASIGETLAVRFLTAGNTSGISIQWGILLAFAVTMCLVTVFRYGVLLQKEWDETL